MGNQGPKTLKGKIRKPQTGDGRKKTELEKFINGETSPPKIKAPKIKAPKIKPPKFKF